MTHVTSLILSSCFHYSAGFSGKRILNGPQVKMDDPKLIAKIVRKFLIPPSSRREPYILKSPFLYDTSMGQAQIIVGLLGGKVSECYKLCLCCNKTFLIH